MWNHTPSRMTEPVEYLLLARAYARMREAATEGGANRRKISCACNETRYAYSEGKIGRNVLRLVAFLSTALGRLRRKGATSRVMYFRRPTFCSILTHMVSFARISSAVVECAGCTSSCTVRHTGPLALLSFVKMNTLFFICVSHSRNCDHRRTLRFWANCFDRLTGGRIRKDICGIVGKEATLKSTTKSTSQEAPHREPPSSDNRHDTALNASVRGDGLPLDEWLSW